MRSIRRLLPLLAAFPLLLTPACSPHPLTPSSSARTDRPTLPTLDPKLTATERLPKLGHPETGVMVSVDKGWLDAATALLSQAIGAVARLNEHIGAIKLERRCTSIRFETGKAPADCPNP